MKNFRAKLPLIGVTLALVMAMVVPAAAQELPGPGEGGVIIESTFGGDPGSFNPLYCTGTDCQDNFLAFMFPALVGVDPAEGVIVPAGRGALATDWEISDDGLVYTFTLRQDLFWTDGTPVTAKDVLFGWEVATNPEAQSPRAYLAASIESVEMVDDYTIRMTFFSPDCVALNYAGSIDIAPAHVFEGIPFSELQEHEFATNPYVSAGVFQMGEYRAGEQFTQIANQDYPDALQGYVVPTGRVLKLVPDQTVQIEQFLAGEITSLDFIPPHRRSDVRAAAEAGEVQVFDFAGNVWDYMAFNLADPTNPQPAFDEEGNRIDQGHHPLFSDKRVRQAIARAVDVDAIVAGAVFGEGTRMPAQLVAASWAIHPDLEPIPYDVEAAQALLEEAGWVMGADGILVATEDALYAEPGTPFRFTLYTNEGNARRETIGVVIQDQLNQVGIDVDFVAIDFNTLLDIMDSQEFDAFILGWRAGYPDDPDTTQLFGAEADVPGSGYNFTSFYNEEYFELEAAARAVPGCDPDERAPYYWRMQEIMQDELPYLWLFSQNGMYAARANVINFNPYPAQIHWNVDEWAIAAQ